MLVHVPFVHYVCPYKLLLRPKNRNIRFSPSILARPTSLTQSACSKPKICPGQVTVRIQLRFREKEDLYHACPVVHSEKDGRLRENCGGLDSIMYMNGAAFTK